MNDAPLVDVSDVSFEALLSGDNQQLAQSTKRLLDSVNDSNEALSAFQSFASVE